MRYRARVEYDGTDFAGFQAQPGARTVQGELEAALASLAGGRRLRVDAAGRTDAGVHAAGQVIAFTYRGRLAAAELGRALDALLPSDVAVRDLRRVPAGFHPRYAARYREYRYTVWTGRAARSASASRSGCGPRSTPPRWRGPGRPSRAGDDYSAFGAADRQPVRTLHRVRVRRDGPLVTIDVRGDAFLRQMVRRIAAALILVGRGEVEESAVAEALASRTPAFNGALAPARGLCLRRVVLGRRAGEMNGDR